MGGAFAPLGGEITHSSSAPPARPDRSSHAATPPRAQADGPVGSASTKHWDALIIPGGYAPDYMRRDEHLLALVRDMAQQDRPVAFICHAGWVPVSAGIVRGRRVTSAPSIRDDLVNAGAEWEDSEVVQDGPLISSRHPGDLPAFCRTLIAALAGCAAYSERNWPSRRQRESASPISARDQTAPAPCRPPAPTTHGAPSMSSHSRKPTTTDAGIPVPSDEYSLTVWPDAPILLRIIYKQIPVNRPQAPVHAYSKEDAMPVIKSKDPVNAPNPKGGPAADPECWPDQATWAASGKLMHTAQALHRDGTNLVQAGNLVRHVVDDAARERLVGNVVGHLKDGVTPPVLERAFEYWRRVDPDVGGRIAAAFEHD